MKAETQYNDFTGTAAADISDHSSLNDFLEAQGVDIKRYEAVGANFYHGYSDFFHCSIICIDQQKSDKETPHLVSIDFEKEFSHKEFFDLFKRFDVVVSMKHRGVQHLEISEEITIDNRK